MGSSTSRTVNGTPSARSQQRIEVFISDVNLSDVPPGSICQTVEEREAGSLTLEKLAARLIDGICFIR